MSLLKQVQESDEKREGRLLNVDFWPASLSAEKGLNNVRYDRFDTLLPKVNAWLRAHSSTEVVKCETLDKKIASPDQLSSDNCLFDEPDQKVFHIKGLRLWYSTTIPAPPSGPPRRHAQQVGYRNLVPRVLDEAGGGTGSKYPAYEDLSATYSTLNDNLIDRPLEGRIISVETVCLRLARCQDGGVGVGAGSGVVKAEEADQTYWEDTPKYHLLYVVRIYYVFECPYYEQVGAADFLPDLITDSKSSGPPRYADFGTLMRKINTWLDKVKDIRITNIQTLEAAVPSADKPERANTSLNFLARVDSLAATVRFLRVTYVRPKYGLPPSGLYAPASVSYVCFVAKRAGEKAQGEYESQTALLERMRWWLNGVDNRLLGVEVLSHPVPLLERKEDKGESSVMRGTWFFPATSESTDSMHRIPTVTVIRLYFDGPLEIDKRSEVM